MNRILMQAREAEDMITFLQEIILRFCEDCELFLSENPKNVVGIHCLGGKGRTGVAPLELLAVFFARV